MPGLPAAILGLESLGSTVIGTAAAVLGIGLLIFVHELGHFLVAKWAGVKVEVFSLGFGPRLAGFVRGDTDYRVSALPLGGYVRMLGQDDADPSATRTADPGDFRNKPVGKRMAILVAGVCMNAIFAVFAFVLAFALGVDFAAPEVGTVSLGSAAEKAEQAGAPDAPRGLRRGDQIVAIDGKEVLGFEDIAYMVALGGDRIAVDLDRWAPQGTQRLTFHCRPQRDDDDSFQRIGIEPAICLAAPAPGSLAETAGLRENDQLLGIAPVGSDLREAIDEIGRFVLEHPGERVRLLVLRRELDQDGRPTKREEVRLEATLGAEHEYDLGLDLHDDARVFSVVIDSPARGKLQTGDIIVSVAGMPATASTFHALIHAVGEASRDPADSKRTRPVPVVVRRRAKDGAAAEVSMDIALERRANMDGWFLGVGWGADRVRSVEPGSPAALAGLEPDDRITFARRARWLGLVWRESVALKADLLQDILRDQRDKPFQLVWEKPSGEERKAVVAARPSSRTYGELAGLRQMQRRVFIHRGVGAACALGIPRTLRTTEQLLLTLRGLLTRRVSGREVGGPIKIFGLISDQALVGLGKLLYVLALLSVNLAVLNILPIPVLDGGHLFFLVIEKLKGRPVSDGVLIATQWIGLFLILGLMVAVTFNDIRSWFQ